jgi:tRNA A37 threonylcarbamoyladenosine modification protein TsaB
MSSLALMACGAPAGTSVAAAMQGGHGELFVQQFEGEPLAPTTALLNLPPEQVAELISADMVVGPGAAGLVAARGWGEAIESWPSAANALKLPDELRALPPRPLYARAPDARAMEAA